MNIFVLDENPKKSVELMCDKHVVKMLVETAQILSTVHRILDGEEVTVKKQAEGSTKARNYKTWVLDDEREDILYKSTHVHHPAVVWAMSSLLNYNWLLAHFEALIEENNHRFGEKDRKSAELLETLKTPPKNIKDLPFDRFYTIMDDQYIISADAVMNYRNYYNKGKKHIHKWTNRPTPEWINDEADILPQHIHD